MSVVITIKRKDGSTQIIKPSDAILTSLKGDGTVPTKVQQMAEDIAKDQLESATWCRLN